MMLPMVDPVTGQIVYQTATLEQEQALRNNQQQPKRKTGLADVAVNVGAHKLYNSIAGSGAGAASGGGGAAADAFGAQVAGDVIVDASGTPIASAAGMGATPAFIPAAVAIQTALSAKSGYDMLRGKAKRINDVTLSDIKNDPAGFVGRAGLAVASGGLSELANFGLSHKSTKQYEAERREDLVNSGVKGLQQFDTVSANAVTDGKPNVIRDPNATGYSAYDDVSALGNYETFGNDWDKYSLEQKAQIAKAIGDRNLYKGDHGDRIITDRETAKTIAQDVLSGKIKVDPGKNPYIRNPELPPEEQAQEGGESYSGGGGGESSKPKQEIKIGLKDVKKYLPNLTKGPRYDLGYKNPYL
jgi:hypothetical protein